MRLMQRILARCGYVKLPKEAIEISVNQERVFHELIKRAPNMKTKKILTQFLKAQQTLTAILRMARITKT